MDTNNQNLKTIYLGGGCFWCVEAVFQNIKGVISVESGYAGGEKINPTYAEVSNGNTGYVEVIKLVYDESIISTENILTVFFASHDPTTFDRQGNDTGSQYRSVIFYESEDVKSVSEKIISEIENDKDIPEGIKKSDFENIHVETKVLPIKNYFKAENYHQNYYNDNKETNGYCRIIINPKLEKVQKRFADLLKTN